MEMDDVEYACLDFTVVEEALGSRKSIELIPGGSEIDVTKENLVEYLEATLEYRLVGRVKDQLKELLLGFYDVIPESLLTIFDFQEVSDSITFLEIFRSHNSPTPLIPKA
jgi:E3 ubiquitin-protein ligase NEDD4